MGRKLQNQKRSKNFFLTDRQTDRQTDGQIDRDTNKYYQMKFVTKQDETFVCICKFKKMYNINWF